MKYRDNMTPQELNQFMREVNELHELLTNAHDHDAMSAVPMPDEMEDPSDYVGMGWVGKNGRP